jgi:hypothetical protein
MADVTSAKQADLYKYACNLKESLAVKSKLAQLAPKRGHEVCWIEAKVLQIEPNTTYRK